MGFLEVTPRRGTVVADFAESGNLETLNAILRYNGGKLDRQMVVSIIELRSAVEGGALIRLGRSHTQEDLDELRDMLAEYAEIAKRTFERILEKRSCPKGRWSKAVPGTRDLKDFALPMILCNMALEAEQMIDRELLDRTIEECIHEVMEVFYREELGLIVENVTRDGQLCNSFEGRQITPGHSLEAMWFIMNLGVRLDDRALIDKAVKIALNTAEYGWDKQYGGLFYCMDRLG